METRRMVWILIVQARKDNKLGKEVAGKVDTSGYTLEAKPTYLVDKSKVMKERKWKNQAWLLWFPAGGS